MTFLQPLQGSNKTFVTFLKFNNTNRFFTFLIDMRNNAKEKKLRLLLGEMNISNENHNL